MPRQRAQPRVARNNGATGDPSTRQALMNSGRRVFARKGYMAATVDDIIRRAKVSRGTFYVYFRNKEDAFQQIIAESIDEMFTDAYRPRARDTSNFEAIKQANQNYLKSFLRHLDVMKALYQADTLNPDIARLHHEYRQKFIARIQRHLERTFSSAPAPAIDPAVAATGLGLMVEYFLYFWQAAKFDQTANFTADAVVETLSILWYRAVYAENPRTDGEAAECGVNDSQANNFSAKGT